MGTATDGNTVIIATRKITVIKHVMIGNYAVTVLSVFVGKITTLFDVIECQLLDKLYIMLHGNKLEA